MGRHRTHSMHESSLAAYAAGDFGARTFAILECYDDAVRVQLSDRDIMQTLLFTDPNKVRPRITELLEAGLIAEAFRGDDGESRVSVRFCFITDAGRAALSAAKAKEAAHG